MTSEKSGKLKGGFDSLSEEQISKIRGGKKGLSDGNDKCINDLQCSGENTGCTNKSLCV